MQSRLSTSIPAVLLLTVAVACTGRGGEQWYRGNTHTHSLWSDGDAAPEVVVDWYRSHGYDFLSLTDHDVLSRGERWVRIGENSRLTPDRVEQIRQHFGSDWVETAESANGPRMRLKTLEELRDRFEEPGRFLLIEGFEISDRAEGKPVHLNVLNPVELVPQQHGATIIETIRNNLRAVSEQGASTGQNLLVHLNHPNWQWAMTPQQLAGAEDARLIEIYNGSAGCNNYGDETHPGMDQAWDIANTIRIATYGWEPLLGIASDDTHDYFDPDPELSLPGRGWIVVRAAALDSEALIEAIEAGAFYASTGVELVAVERSRRFYRVEISAEEGVEYTTQFIGTRMINSQPGEPGIVLLESTENPAVYRYAGDELYVRARVVSSRPHQRAAAGEEAPAHAWTQPVVPRRR